MKKNSAKKLELVKETLRNMDLKEVSGQTGINNFDPAWSFDGGCTFSTIA